MALYSVKNGKLQFDAYNLLECISLASFLQINTMPRVIILSNKAALRERVVVFCSPINDIPRFPSNEFLDIPCNKPIPF